MGRMNCVGGMNCLAVSVLLMVVMCTRSTAAMYDYNTYSPKTYGYDDSSTALNWEKLGKR